MNAAASVALDRQVVCILGLPFDAVTLGEAAARVRRAARGRHPLLLSTANLNFVIAAARDAAFRHSLIHSQLSLADGMPIVWISRLLGLPIPERVPGSGLFEHLSRTEPEQPVKVYFFGAPDGVAERASERVNAQPQGVRCVGFEAPGYVPMEQMSTAEHIDRINAADPDFVVLSLGAQKGQAWIEHNRARVNAPVLSHLGAVVGFVAGELKRAPEWVQRLGLEWAWRIKEEPQLWRRYYNDGRQFLRLFFDSVLPLCWQRLRGPRTPLAALVRCSTEFRRADHFEIRAGSVCGSKELPVFRAALAQAAQARCRVTIDFRHTSYLDSMAMGSLLLLYGFQRDIGQPLHLENVSIALARVFRLHCAEYLLGPRSVCVDAAFPPEPQMDIA